MLLYYVRKQDKNNKGFTLIEMITVVIIVGVIAAIAAPNFLSLLNQNRVKQALEQVEGAVKESQRLAIRRGKTCRIKFVTKTIDGESRQTINVVEDTDTGETISAGYYNGCLLNERVLPADVSINTGGMTKISFSGKGNSDPAINTGTVIISHPQTDTIKCLEVQGFLGNILTGNYVDSDSDNNPDTCRVS